VDATAAICVPDGPELGVALPGGASRDRECRARCRGVRNLCPRRAVLVGAKHAAPIGAVDTSLSLARRVGDLAGAEGAPWRGASIERAAGGRVTRIGRRRGRTREGKKQQGPFGQSAHRAGRGPSSISAGGRGGQRSGSHRGHGGQDVTRKRCLNWQSERRSGLFVMSLC